MKSKSFLLVSLFLFHSSSSNIYQPRVDLEFEIQAVYKGQVSQLGIRGNGLGLNFETSSEMQQISDQVWSYTIKFQYDEFGFRCGNCSDQSESFISHGDKLKLKFYALQNETEFPSLGSTFDVLLPISKVSSHFPNRPTRTFNPYFFTKEGVVFSMDIKSHDPILGTRNIAVYVPPGALENPKVVYDRLFIIDMNKDFAHALKPVLDETFIDGVASDTIIIGFGDWKPDPIYQDIPTDRGNLLTPIVGDATICKEGTFEDRCNGCLPENFTAEDYLYWMTEGGCGITIQHGGYADASLDFLFGSVQNEINNYLLTNYRVLLTNDRSGTFLLGFSLGGLFSCYSGWTRPSVLHGVGCQSPSLWWPNSIKNGTVVPLFYLPSLILEADVGPRPYMDILIDVGEAEEDKTYQMVSEAELFYEILGSHDSFTKDVNLWLNVYPGQNHTAENWIGRIYSPLTLLLRDRV